MFDFFAVTNRGLEPVCAAEMARVPGLQITATGYRRVHATFRGAPQALLALRTVDDLFVHLAEWMAISHKRDALADFTQRARDLDLWHAVNLHAELAPLPDEIAFSVSANFVGRRNYSADEIKDAIAAGVTAITGWRYAVDDRASDLNLRVFIEHDAALVGLRLGKAPLYKRAYKVENLPGSLKPSVAAALVQLAAAPTGAHLLDPCCGAGTILIEAAVMGLVAHGGDQAVAAVEAARRNAAAAAVDIDVQAWDARTLPLADGTLDCAVTNLPWGRQVAVDSALAEFYAAVCGEMARVTAAAGRIVVLTNRPELVTLPMRILVQRIAISLFGQQPEILVFGPAPNTSSIPDARNSAV